MKRILALCLWLSTALVAQGQKRYYVDLSTVIMNGPFQAGRITEIVDARADRAGIGWVQLGLANAHTPADLKDGLTTALRRLVQTLPSTGSSTSYALRIHQLRIGEVTQATTEVASVDLVVDLLRPRPDGQYELLARAAQGTERRGVDVTPGHGPNIASALQGCLAQFDAAGPATLPAVAVLTAEQAAAPVDPLGPLTPYPLLTEAVRRPGVYHSFEEFRRNEPSGKKVVLLRKEPRTKPGWEGTAEVELNYLDEQGYTTPVRNVWGYCDGQDLYILHRRHFYQLLPVKGGFMFEAPSAAEGDDVASGAAIGGLVGGVVGSAVGGAAAAAVSGGKRQEHTLNLLTGRITAQPLPNDESAFGDENPAGQDGRVVVYRRKTTGPAVEVYAGPLRAGTLSAETGSVTVLCPSRRDATKLCLRPASGPETCVEVLPQIGEVLYFEWVDGSGTSRLKPVNKKEGAYESHRAEVRTGQAAD